MNYNNEVNNILHLYNNKKLHEYNMDNILDRNKYDILYLLLIKIKNNYNNENKNYKMEYYYNLFEHIINNNYQLFVNNRDLLYLLFTKLTILYKGNLLINKFINIIDDIKLNNSEIQNLLIIASMRGSLLSFLLWLKIYNKSYDFIINNNINLICNNINHEIFSEKLFSNSIINSDDRIYKYILNIDNINIILNTPTIISLINCLGDSMNIPVKYKLKKLKILSKNINLNDYFFDMIIKFTDNQSLYLIHKYYYTNTNNIYTISNMYNVLSNINCFEPLEYLKYYNILKTDTEKLLYIILCSLKHNYYNNNISYNKKNFKTLIIEYNQFIIDIISSLHLSDDFFNNNNLNNYILNILCNNNLITKYIEKKASDYYLFTQNNNILKFTKFLVINNNNTKLYRYAILTNRILHNIRLYVKRKRNNKFLFNKYKTLEIIHEINNIKSLESIIILKNNSYQILNLDFYNNNKFKNIFINNKIYNNYNIIPYNHYPYSDIFNIYNTIDAYYDESNDLYIINDINIPNTSFIDRYLLLLQSHDFISFKSINTISNINEFNDLLIKYNLELNKFINNNCNIKWFPNLICLIINKNNHFHHMH